ncbi:MAG TPA: hypothetical protein PK027_11780 [Aquimonas sp.]|jgi:hypothetical protein|nr:hypothetical protein [Xanthomonadales bacterium]HRD73214.1 hypothetical protein [Aquimonas sp.]HRF55123.1 hypothetical protein [Aquimonas sp.]
MATFNLILLVVGVLWSVTWFGVLLRLLLQPTDRVPNVANAPLRDSARALM